MLCPSLDAVEPRFLLDEVPMNALAGDDSIIHATLWMVLMLAVGVASLMLAFLLIAWCVRWCLRPTDEVVDPESQVTNTWNHT
jgi:hypothetical protein